ncbi:MAG TPA: hypothetical protein VNO52_02810 [Methylomirabilota bacterium]|nr:hypothetical protein [Methylomirabilota bacterium]
MSTYRSYRDLPPLAGLCSLAEAMKPGLSVEDCVGRLKRLHYAFKRLHQIFVHRLTAEPVYELKMGFSLHAHVCAEHVAALRRRVGEMREPPLGLEAVPHPALEVFFDEVLAAPTTEELLLGLYEKAVPALEQALQRHLADTNPLADHPSVRLCRFALLEVEEMRRYGAACVVRLVSGPCRAGSAAWSELLDDCLAAAGGLDGSAASRDGAPARRFSAQPHRFDPVPRRDERFPDPYNMGVNAEVFLYDPKYPPRAKTLMMFYKRLREIDVPEMMASIIAETPDQPWDYYRDMTRQLWDEARHAMMGEVGFANLGINWSRDVMVNFTWSLALNTQLKPIERHAVLYFIEQGLMPRTGKRFEWETAVASQNPLAALFQDYDWADEVLHARIGRDWYLKEFADAKAAVQYGDECWSRVLMNWDQWRRDGKTAHRNWWPDLYRAACQHWQIQPDPEVLAYATSYESVRADLKNLSASA